MIENSALEILWAIVPAFAPYGPALELAFTLALQVAPEIYAEIRALILRVQSGGEITAADKARLTALIASLKNPEWYFAHVPQVPADVAAQQIAEVIAQGQTGLEG